MQFCKIYRDDGNICIFIMNMYEDESGMDKIEIRAEREDDPDIYAGVTLPGYYCHHAYGFSEQEILRLQKFLKNNAVSIWNMARENLYAKRFLMIGEKI